MSEGTKKTITITKISDKPWNQPNTDTWYYGIEIEGYGAEPINYICNKTKGTPEPKLGDVSGTVFPAKNGFKFYPDKNQQPVTQSTQPSTPATPQQVSLYEDKSPLIRAQWAIGHGVTQHGQNLDLVEGYAQELFRMVDRVKDSAQPTVESGYDKAKTARAALPPQDVVIDDFDQNEPVNLDDIPF
jgi:hypothetical protein